MAALTGALRREENNQKECRRLQKELEALQVQCFRSSFCHLPAFCALSCLLGRCGAPADGNARMLVFLHCCSSLLYLNFESALTSLQGLLRERDADLQRLKGVIKLKEGLITRLEVRQRCHKPARVSGTASSTCSTSQRHLVCCEYVQ